MLIVGFLVVLSSACNTAAFSCRSLRRATLGVISNVDVQHLEEPLQRKLNTVLCDGTGAVEYERKRSKLGAVPIISRTIPIAVEVPTDNEGNLTKKLDITIWEMEKPSEIIQTWWSVDESERTSMGDPFGVVMWPGSIVASRELMRQHYLNSPSLVANSTVLILGAGTGVEAQTAALLEAKRVIATDCSQLTLKLLEFATESRSDDAEIKRSMKSIVECRYFDVFSGEKLPECDVFVAADVLYNSDLARQIGLRLYESISRALSDNTAFPKIIITDSQQFHGTNFLVELNELRDLNELLLENGFAPLQWEDRNLKNVVGSGVLLDEDQVYDANVRMISWGWEVGTLP